MLKFSLWYILLCTSLVCWPVAIVGIPVLIWTAPKLFRPIGSKVNKPLSIAEAQYLQQVQQAQDYADAEKARAMLR